MDYTEFVVEAWLRRYWPQLDRVHEVGSMSEDDQFLHLVYIDLTSAINSLHHYERKLALLMTEGYPLLGEGSAQEKLGLTEKEARSLARRTYRTIARFLS